MDGDSSDERDAFFAFLATFTLSRQILTISDLCDGVALFEVLEAVDPAYFKLPARSSAQSTDNWVLRLNTLKRLYRLITQYLTDVLHQPTTSLEVPNLHAMAKDYDMDTALEMCRLAIAITVQSEINQEIIAKIQGLSETNQHYLKGAIEKVMSGLAPTNAQGSSESSMTDDDHYYQIQSERRRILAEKETLEKVYTALLNEHRTLQISHDDALAEKDDALSRLRESTRQLDTRRQDKADSMMRAEIDRLRLDLQKSEESLNVVEIDLERHQILVTDLQHTVDELQVKADEAVRLKDKVDEYRHAADKLQKTENVMEKYKKKLEESADLRRRLKALEDQNASLVDQNASLEEEYRRVSLQKPLLESYKTQVSDLEGKLADRNKEIDTLKFEVEQSQIKVRMAEEERTKDAEALELYQERVRELELSSTVRLPKTAKAKVNGEAAGQEGVAEEEGSRVEQFIDSDVDYDDDPTAHGLGGELDDAITGTTTTDLKLQIRQLKRDLEAARTNSAEASRILVLENLLEDANRMKSRYESDYLAEHREKLVLQRNLEEIRSGKAHGDGPEAAIALRQRLNEAVDQLDAVNKRSNELEVKCEGQAKELTVAKSDLNLVNKDQLEILTSLRESVNEDKADLESDVDTLRNQLKEAQDKDRMQVEQINMLLMDKVSLQSDGISQREKMLERERNLSDLRASMNGQELPEDVKERILSMHENSVQLKEQLKTTQEKLAKARAFIKSQHKLFQEEHTRSNATSPAMFEEVESSYKSQIKVLEEEIERLKRSLQEEARRYQKEYDSMTGLVHKLGREETQAQLGRTPRLRNGTSSWLLKQRLERTLVSAAS